MTPTAAAGALAPRAASQPAGWLRAARAARAFGRRTHGATMTEYALLLAVVALVAVVGARRIGLNFRLGGTYFNAIVNAR